MMRRRRRRCGAAAGCWTLWLLVQQQCREGSVLGWQQQPAVATARTAMSSSKSATAFRAASSSSSPFSQYYSPHRFDYSKNQRISRRRMPYQIGSDSSTAIRQSDHAEDEHDPSLLHRDHPNNQLHRGRSSLMPPTRIVSSLVARIRRGRNGKNGTTSRETKKKCIVPVMISPQEVARMQRENLLLRGALQRLEVENERLHRKMARSLVLESFEGEGALWDADAASPMSSKIFNGNNQTIMDYDSLVRVGGGGAAAAAASRDVATLSPFTATTTTTLTSEELLAQEAALWCDDDMEDSCPVEPDVSFGEALRDRAYWLVGLLALQSCSGLILAHNEALIQHHPFIVYFLTMLVGAGGNAGNQASVRVIRGLALGTLNEVTQTRFLAREFKMAVALSFILSVAGFLRAAAFKTPFAECVALSMALFLIVSTSVCLGAILPIGLKRIGIDPAHSSTTIQVIMDILGVVLAVAVSSILLDSPVGNMIIARLGG